MRNGDRAVTALLRDSFDLAGRPRRARHGRAVRVRA